MWLLSQNEWLASDHTLRGSFLTTYCISRRSGMVAATCPRKFRSFQPQLNLSIPFRTLDIILPTPHPSCYSSLHYRPPPCESRWLKPFDHIVCKQKLPLCNHRPIVSSRTPNHFPVMIAAGINSCNSRASIIKSTKNSRRSINSSSNSKRDLRRWVGKRMKSWKANYQQWDILDSQHYIL